MGQYKLAHLCLRLGLSKALRENGGINPMCLIPFRSKVLRDVWDIAPMGQYELARLCLRLGRRKALRKNGMIAPMCIILF